MVLRGGKLNPGFARGAHKENGSQVIIMSKINVIHIDLFLREYAALHVNIKK